MSVSDTVRQLEEELVGERKRRRDAETAIEEVRHVLEQYSESSAKAWGRTLAKIGRLVGVEVRS